MESEEKAELASLLTVLPPVEFCCVYGSALHPNNSNKSSMVDYILGVSNPLQWHTEITEVADEIGVGVHFNPFVTWKDKIFKYGVVRMDDLIRDVLNWERFYLGGRLQKPVHILVDNLDIGKLNSVNLRAATSAALLLSPSKFSEENLYAKICSLSYMGDLRMLFAEDKNKVNKIVKGQFKLFQTMYKPFLEECATKDLLRFSSSGGNQAISQDRGLSAASSLVSRLPPAITSEMGLKLGEKKHLSESGQATRELVIGSREEAAECMRKIVRRKVLVSSARQAVSGLLMVGAVHGVRYLANKMHKAWKSLT
ncbi:uncharacterized protein LOC130784079 isoform X2 [Actinidia eriantha]|uniref:uncharacterized protein LOC130784079 isoform X2 n=1 Tax=Actinidia eriantha TaxID=165200 RepID=UPI002583F4F7|nr:uncharacterized protein LOC130784079 isoform X2 [Actinidia eriantha]